jgi:hypothetical protein
MPSETRTHDGLENKAVMSKDVSQSLVENTLPRLLPYEPEDEWFTAATKRPARAVRFAEDLMRIERTFTFIASSTKNRDLLIGR